jgi:CubicO group peptidase (beta-lactamase class C family)
LRIKKGEIFKTAKSGVGDMEVDNKIWAVVALISVLAVGAGFLMISSFTNPESTESNIIHTNNQTTGNNYTNNNSSNILPSFIPFTYFNILSNDYNQINPTTTTTPVPPEPAPDIISLFDAYVKSTFPQTGIPGGAIVIVQNDQIVYMNCLGVKDIASGAPVTPDTLFYIASCSKAFTSTNIAQLVDQNLMSWDDPVITYYPKTEEFQLYDPTVTNTITIRDLLLHRSGLPNQCGDLNGMLFNDSFSDIIYKFRYVENNTPFRSKWQYQTLMYALAGEYAARANKTVWSDLIKEDLLETLGMTTTTTTLNDYLNSPDHTSTYIRSANGTLMPYGPNGAEYDAPSGNIASSIKEMANWLSFQIADTGIYNGVQIVSKSNLDETHRGQIYEDNTNILMYGFGWNIIPGISFDHAGSNGDGASIVAFYPTKGTGIVVLLNENNYGLAYAPALKQKFQSLLVGDYNTDPWPVYRDLLGPKPNPPIPPIVDPQPLNFYTGLYNNAFYGNINITTDTNILTCYYGNNSGSHALKHWNGDVFEDPTIPGSLFNFTDYSGSNYQKVTVNVFIDYTETPNAPAEFNLTNSIP